MGLISKQRIEFIRSKVSAYSSARIQEFSSLMLLLYEANISSSEFHQYASAVKKGILNVSSARARHWLRIAPTCPACGSLFNLKPIRIKQGAANKFGFKSLWYCVDDECAYEEFSTRPYTELFKNQERLYNISIRPLNGPSKEEKNGT